VQQAEDATETGRLQEASSLYTRVEEVCLSSMGTSHPITQAATWRLATSYLRVGDYKRQAATLERLLDRAGLESHDAARCLHRLTVCSLSLGEPAHATVYATKALEACDSPSSALYTALAVSQACCEDSAARAGFEKAADVAADVEIPRALWMLGSYLWHCRQDGAAAIETWQTAFHRLGEAQEMMELRACLLRDLGEVQIAEKEFHAAIENLNESINAAEAVDPGHWLVGTSLCQLARSFFKQENAVTAEGLFRGALNKLGSSSIDEHLPSALAVHLAYTLHEYASLLQMWEKRQGEAALMRERANHVECALPLGLELSRFSVPYIKSEERNWIPVNAV